MAHPIRSCGKSHAWCKNCQPYTASYISARKKGKRTAPSFMPSRAKTMEVSDAAWLAGFFDGEGSVFKSVQVVRGSLCERWTLSIPNTCRASLERCLAITGAGNITDNPPRNAKHKMQWSWRVGRRAEIRDVLSQIAPYLTIKAEKATACMEDISG